MPTNYGPQSKERVRGTKAGMRHGEYQEAQREATRGRWAYEIAPFLYTKGAMGVPVDDLDFVSTEYPHTVGR